MIKQRLYCLIFILCLSFVIFPSVIAGFVPPEPTNQQDDNYVKNNHQGFSFAYLLSILVEIEEDTEEKESEREKEDKGSKSTKLISAFFYLHSFLLNKRSVQTESYVNADGAFLSYQLPLFIQFGNFRL